jgi:hypothetical protein
LSLLFSSIFLCSCCLIGLFAWAGNLGWVEWAVARAATVQSSWVEDGVVARTARAAGRA